MRRFIQGKLVTGNSNSLEMTSPRSSKSQTNEHTVQSTNTVAEAKCVTNVSKTQIDRLGDRLRKREITESDLRMLDEFRHSFYETYEFVTSAIRKELRLELTS